MKATRIVVLLAFAMIATAAVAQEGAPPVAKEMAKYDALVGNWQGSGVVRMGPDAPETPWTSTSTVKRILDGHFVMDQAKIEAGGMPIPMLFTSVGGWDSVRQRYVSFELGNTGQAKENTVHFVGNKIISTSSGVEDGAVVADHWVTVIEGDEMHFKGHRSVDGGTFFVHVEGSAKRGGPGFTVGPETADYGMAPPNEHLAPLGAIVGSWDFTGDWKPAPDVDAMPISGHEKVQIVLGGHALRAHVDGEGGGMDFQAVNFMAWSADDNCILSVGFNNMGEYHASQCWMVDGRLISVGVGPYQGVPTISRGIMEMSENELTWEGLSASGNAEPYLAFTGTWTRSNR